MMSSQVENIIKLYRTLSQIPTITGARIVSNKIVESIWNQKNLEKGKPTKFQQTQLIDSSLTNVNDFFPVDISHESLSKVSPTEKFRATIRDYNDEKNNRKQFLEIWQRNNLLRSVDLSSVDVHGDVYADNEFGSLEWSPCERKVAYIAEKKLPKLESFYKRKSVKDLDNGDIGDKVLAVKGEEYLYRQDWGEQLVGKYKSVICVYDVNLDNIDIINGVPESHCPGQILWTSNGNGFIGVAWNSEPRKLGLNACTSRDNRLFYLSLDGEYHEISLTNKSVRSPRLSPDGKTLVWLERKTGGPHHSCHALMKINFPPKPEDVPTPVIDYVDTQCEISGQRIFYGIYSLALPKRCFTSDSKRLLFSTQQKVTVQSYIVDLTSGNLTELEYNDGSQIVLDVNNDMVVTVCNNLKTPDMLAIAKIPSVGEERNIEWHFITKRISIKELDEIDYNCHYLYLDHGNKEEVSNCSAIYYGPESGPKNTTPLVLLPHGGPHFASANTFALTTSLYALLGIATLQINYRGSTGAGQKSLYYLINRIGEADVNDCMLAIRTALEKFPQLNAQSVALSGGSHGGFLVAHLSGQYPDFFKAVVARNPVIDVASMYMVSDIPDWCSVLANCDYTQKGPISESLMIRQRNVSPIINAHKVKAPTLLLIGSEDLRVPPSQGTEYYHRLRANGVKTKMNLYKDNHNLLNVPTDIDVVVNTMKWLLEHLKHK